MLLPSSSSLIAVSVFAVVSRRLLVAEATAVLLLLDWVPGCLLSLFTVYSGKFSCMVACRFCSAYVVWSELLFVRSFLMRDMDYPI